MQTRCLSCGAEYRLGDLHVCTPRSVAKDPSIYNFGDHVCPPLRRASYSELLDHSTHSLDHWNEWVKRYGR